MNKFKNFLDYAWALVISLLAFVGLVEVVMTIALTSLFGLFSQSTILVVSLGLILNIPWWIDTIILLMGLGWMFTYSRAWYFYQYEILCWLVVRVGNKLQLNSFIWQGARWAGNFSYKRSGV